MAVIKSSASTDQLIIDSSKAARVTLYDTFGNPVQEYPTYSGSATVVAPAGTTPFFAVYGSSSKKIRIKKIILSGGSLTAVEYNVINAIKYSTAISGGTAVSMTRVPLDSASGAASVSILNTYTAAPTAGTVVGNISSRRILLQATTAVAEATPTILEIDLNTILNSSTEGICLSFGGSPGSAVTISVEIKWEEI